MPYDFTPDFEKGGGLIAAVTVDADDGEVLMVAFMNDEAFRLTIETGYVHYWSRSRNALWKKGETSGSLQRLVELRVDCDADAVVVRVRSDGPACHEGFRSCFHWTAAEGGVVLNAEPLKTPDELYGPR